MRAGLRRKNIGLIAFLFLTFCKTKLSAPSIPGLEQKVIELPDRDQSGDQAPPPSPDPTPMPDPAPVPPKMDEGNEGEPDKELPPPEVPKKVPSLTPSSCKEIRTDHPMSANGIYKIYLPDNNAEKKAVIEAYCGMDDDGGGWTLILNYVHKSSTNPSLKIKPYNLPFYGSNLIGVDESVSAPDNWGQASASLINAIPFTEVMFYCRTSVHAKKLHFKTSSSTCINALKTGVGHCRDAAKDFKALANHETNIPAMVDLSEESKGDLVASDGLFGIRSKTSRPSMWNIRAGGDMRNWDCDTGTSDTEPQPSTIHRIWVR